MLQSLFKKKYDEKMRNKAFSGLALRLVVAGYIVYLAYMIAFGSNEGESSMTEWCAILICVLFFICSVAFTIYAFRSFIRSIRAAEICISSDSEEQ